MGKNRNIYWALVGEPEQRPLGRPRHKWEDNIKMYFKEMECEWIHLTLDREKWRDHGHVVIKLRVPYNEGNLFTSLGTIRFLRPILLNGDS
jgi:hypothetical protein